MKDENSVDTSSTGIVTSSSSNKSSVTDTHPETDTNCPVSSSTPFAQSKNASGSPHSGIFSFFHKRTLERSFQASASALNKPDAVHKLESVNKNDSDDTVAVVSGLQAKQSSELTAHQSPCEELRDEEDFDPELNRQSSSVAREDLLTCERCGQEVLVWEMPEHTDYHFALDLQNSLSSSTNAATTPPSSSLTPLREGATATAQPSRGKAKSRGQSGPQPKRQRSQVGNTGTLDSFFKRS